MKLTPEQEEDRELLEMAAKAAGMPLGSIGFAWDAQEQCFWRHEPDQDGISGPWSPLTDDGDALRLAVKLQIPIKTEWREFAFGEAYMESRLMGNDEALQQTRFSIVRAAAEIGRSMP